jgi:hypothetical protein
MDASTLIAFLTLRETASQDGYIGAILTIDPQGMPKEFRCTHPVKPTAIQKPLYGNMLEPYIAIELCGKPLLQSIQNKPSLVVVEREYLLDVRAFSPYPVIFVRRAGEIIEVTPSNSATPISPKFRVECSTGRFQPIVITTHPDYSDDLAIRPDIEEVFAHLDFLEEVLSIGV